MQTINTMRYSLLSGFLLFLFFLPTPNAAGRDLELIAPQESQSWIKLTRNIIAGHGAAVSASPTAGHHNYDIKLDLTIKANCNSGENLDSMGFRDTKGLYHGKELSTNTDIISFSSIPFTTTEQLRGLCGNTNKTINHQFELFVGYQCVEPGALYGTHHNDSQALMIPLKITCEDVLPPDQIPATVTPAKIEFKCPQITASQPQNGNYFDMARIVVLGTQYAHLYIDAENDTQGRTCVRIWNDNNSGDAYISLSEQEPVTGTQ